MYSSASTAKNGVGVRAPSLALMVQPKGESILSRRRAGVKSARPREEPTKTGEGDEEDIVEEDTIEASQSARSIFRSSIESPEKRANHTRARSTEEKPNIDRVRTNVVLWLQN